MTPFAQALSEALLQFVWQGLAVSLLLWTTLSLLKKSSPQARYLASCAALAVLAALPVITLFAMYDPQAGIPLGTAAITLTIRAISLPAPWFIRFLGELQPVAQTWLLRAWLLGVIYLSLRLAWTGGQISSLRRSGRPADERVLRLAASLAARMGVKRAVRVLVSSLPDGPSVTGWLRPVVLIPTATILNLTAEQLESVLAHEIAHLQRYDDIVNIAQSVVETLLFYHPAVWWVSGRIRHERELCCDDLAVKTCGDPLGYARALTALEKLRVNKPGLVSAALSATGGSLAYRIRRIAGARTQEYLPSSLPGLLALGLALSCVAIYSSPARGAAQSLHDPIAYPESARSHGVQGTVPVEVKVDGNGHISGARAIGGPRELRAAAVESVTASALHMTPGTKRIDVAFQLAAEAADFAGRVVEDSSGETVASAELKIHKAGQRELVADLETDRAGRFAGTGLPAGDYTVSVSKPNFITTTFPIHLPNATLQLRLLHYGVMDGKVTNERGEPSPGRLHAVGGETNGATRITVLARQPGSEDFRPFRDMELEEGGRYRFFDLPPGQYELGMWYYGLKEGAGMQLYPDNVHPRIFTVAGGEVYDNLNFRITANPQYSVSGRVELPTPGARFTLALGMPDQPALPLAKTNAGEDGSFTFQKVPAGTYDLFAAGPVNGYTAFESVLGRKDDPLFGRIRIQVSGPLNNLSVPVSSGRSIRVVLKPHGSDQVPAACPQSASVTVASLEPWGIASFNASAQASFATEQIISNLPPSHFRLTASGLGAGCYQVNKPEVDLGQDLSQPVAIELAAAGSVRGTLRSAGAGPADFVVVLLDPTGAPDAPSQVAFPDAQGKFTFAALHPGHYRIAAQPAGEASKARWVSNLAAMAEIDVAGGIPTEIDLPVNSTQKGPQ